MALLDLDRVGIHFGGLKAVDGVSLAIEAGRRRAIIGPNGAGKTTLFNAITGELRLSTGHVRFAGQDVSRLRPDQRAALGLSRTFQITNLFPGLSVDENVKLAVRALSRRKFSLLGPGRVRDDERERVEAALERSALVARRDHLVRNLSYGEQRQLELAMALTGQPKLLLLDEPAAGLSPAERVAIARLIRALPTDLTLVLIEHDIDLALGLVDYVTCMCDGKVLVEGTPAEIRANESVQEVYLGRPHHA
jgi:branched-chain amino acid transport system ATP-binding protein